MKAIHSTKVHLRRIKLLPKISKKGTIYIYTHITTPIGKKKIKYIWNFKAKKIKIKFMGFKRAHIKRSFIIW